jgi:putative addiction module killer protein
LNPANTIEVQEYLRPSGSSPYTRWFKNLNPEAAAKVTTAVTRMSQSKLSNVKSVGAGVHEYTIDFGPGYRVYFGRDGQRLIILLGGGTKKRQ